MQTSMASISDVINVGLLQKYECDNGKQYGRKIFAIWALAHLQHNNFAIGGTQL